MAGPSPNEAPTRWSGPGGFGEVLGVALPLVVSSLSWTVMTFVDRMFLQWESGEAMSASFSGGLVWFAACSLPLGICTYVNTFVSQYHGAGRSREIGPSVWQGVWVAVIAAPVLLAMGPLAGQLFTLVGHGAEVTRQEIVYFQVLCWASPPLLASAAMAGFYSGRGKTVVVMVVDTASVVVNLALDWVLIFGNEELSVPGMGIAGAAWATVIAFWLKSAVYATLVLRRRHREEFGTLAGLRFARQRFARLLYFGGPSGLQMLLDVVGFTVFVLLIGRLGAVEAEATTLAFSVSTLAFMPVWGVGLAVSILVGQHLGEDRDADAARSAWTGLVISAGYMGLISVFYVLTPDVFLFGFFEAPVLEGGGLEGAVLEGAAASDGHAVSDGHAAAVYVLALTLLRFVAAYNLGDAVVMVLANALKGAGDTRFILGVSVLMASSLAGLSWLAVGPWGLGVTGCWWVITLWLWSISLIFLFRFLAGRWRSMRVIEPEPLPSAGGPAPGDSEAVPRFGEA